jgi:hypothetical protein
MARYTSLGGMDRVAGRGRVATPLLGGVRGWVYPYDTSFVVIIVLE